MSTDSFHKYNEIIAICFQIMKEINLMTIYCVYITFYRGNLLPPFYIGYSSLDKIKKGYHGTVKSKAYKNIWINEIKNNNHLFKTVIISYHDSREAASKRETQVQLKLKVHKNPLYINRAISGYKFYRKSGEYNHSAETKAKIGLANSKKLKGHIPHNKGKPMGENQKKHLSKINTGKKLSEETKKKISETMKKKALNKFI